MAAHVRLIHLLVLSIAWSTSLWATQWTVDNSPNSPGQFSNLQAAIDSAGVGDTLLITGTNTTYGTAIVDKPLVLIGAGYYPNGSETIVNQVTLVSSDVFVTGLHGSIVFDLANAPGDSLANITVTRCQMDNPGLRFTSSNQVVVERLIDIAIYNNVIGRIGFYDGCAANNVMQFDSLFFGNNITSRFSFNANCLPTFQGTETFIIDHNLFIGPSGGCVGGNQECGIFSDQYGPAAWPTSMAILSNNIFRLTEVGGIQGCGQCTWFNNITYGSGANDSIPGTPAGNENQWSVDPLLVNYSGGGFSWSHDYTLQTGSSAIGTASDNISNIGPSGGQYPFELGAPPSGPFIEYFNVDGSAIEINGDVIINFKAYGRP